MPDLSQDQWAAQLAQDKNAVIIDVRTQDEISEGYIPNAKHMDIYEPEAFMQVAQALDATQNHYVYCRSGARSAQACAVLGSVGVTNSYNLLGGILEWKGEITQ